MDVSQVYDLPKVELHCHLDGSYRVNTVFKYKKVDKKIKTEKGVVLLKILNSQLFLWKTPWKNLQRYQLITRTTAANDD